MNLSRYFQIAAVVIVLGYALLDYPRSHGIRTFAFEDPGFNLAADDFVARGYLPNVDFGYAYGPLLLILNRAWFGVFGRSPTSYWASMLACNIGMAYGLTRAAKALAADVPGWLLLLLTLPMYRIYALLVYGYEPLLISFALAEQARGRRPASLALLTACLFVKPTMAYVYGFLLVLLILRDAWRAGSGDLSRWWRPFVPAAIVGIACLLVASAVFGLTATKNTLLYPFTLGPAHYRINHFGFFQGIGGRNFLRPAGVRWTYYLGTYAGLWLAATAVLLAAAVTAVLRRPAGHRNADTERSDEIVTCCALMHAAFVTLFYAHVWSWIYYFFVLILGIVAARGQAFRIARWALVLGAILPLGFHLRSTATLWKTLAPHPETQGLWASKEELENWKIVSSLIKGSRPVVIAPIGGLELLDPAHFQPQTSLTLYRYFTLPVEVERKKKQLASASTVVVYDTPPLDHLVLKDWPELEAEMAEFELQWEDGRFHVYRRRSARRSE
jgi:hypothetical protein